MPETASGRFAVWGQAFRRRHSCGGIPAKSARRSPGTPASTLALGAQPIVAYDLVTRVTVDGRFAVRRTRIRAVSSAGRASRLHREGRRFDPVTAHHSHHQPHRHPRPAMGADHSDTGTTLDNRSGASLPGHMDRSMDWSQGRVVIEPCDGCRLCLILSLLRPRSAGRGMTGDRR